MKRKLLTAASVVLILGLLVGLLIQHRVEVANLEATSPAALPVSVEKTRMKAENPDRAEDVAGLRRQPLPDSGPTDGMVLPLVGHPLADVIRGEIAVAWRDVEGKPSRRRTRIVEADFKYPMLRLEEEEVIDPQSGERSVRLVKASVADHLIVEPDPGVNQERFQAVLRGAGFGLRDKLTDGPVILEVSDFTRIESLPEALLALEALEEFIDFAEPDYLVFPCLQPNDPLFASGQLWGLNNPGSEAGSVIDADIDAPEAWDLRHDASSVVVAVTDTGIQYHHEDLAPNMWTGPGGVYGFDAYDDDDDPMDFGGHGTHCAGTIGARGNNGIGSAGVAWNIQLMALRFLGQGGGTTSDAIRVVNYARLNGADIISASWGGGGYSQSLANAIEACGEAGIPFVAAAGNSASDNDSRPHYPSSYDLTNVVAVASTTAYDELSHFSCFGRYSVDLAAPGSGIWSSYIGSDSSYRSLNGTSMATPHVAGALALAKAHFPGEGVEELINRLYSSVDSVPVLDGKVATGGRLNLHRLLGASSSSATFDAFDGAYRFDGGFGYWSGSNGGATREPGEDDFSLPGTGDRSLWFAWTAPAEGFVGFEAEADRGSLRLVAFEGAEKEGLEVRGDSGSDASRQSIRFHTEQGVEYRFLVDSSDPAGQRLKVSLRLMPGNDNVLGAIRLSGDAFATEGTNRGATAEPFEVASPHAGVGQGMSVWWVWNAPATSDFVISTLGSAFDSVLAVYEGDPASGLTEIASNDDRSPFDWTSQVEFEAVGGTDYYIAVDSYRSDAAGPIVLNGFGLGTLSITRQPQDAEAELGERVVFNVVALAGGDVRYQWLLDDEPVPGGNSGTLVIDPVGNDDFGTYEVVVSNQVAEIRSEPAELREILTPPVFERTSGNQAVLVGDPVRLSTVVSGSLPISFSWEKDGSPLAGEGSPGFSISSAELGDAGVYRCTAVNAAGSASTDMRVSVVESPLDGWEWRREGFRNDSITDIREFDGRLYAVSGEKILVSDDAVNWQPWLLPVGFRGTSLARLGGVWFCSGTVGGEAKMTTSSDGVVWTAPQDTTGVTRYYVSDPAALRQMVAFDGKLYGWARDGVQYGAGYGLGWVVESTDGIHWSRIMLPTGFELRTATRMTVGPDRLLVCMWEQTCLLASSGSWVVTDIPDVGSSDLSNGCFLGGQYYVSDTRFVWQSPDGINWSEFPFEERPPASWWPLNTMTFGLPGGVLQLQIDSQGYGWGPALDDIETGVLLPEGDRNFTAGIVFGDQVVYGTRNGEIHRVGHPRELATSTGSTRPLVSLAFLNGEFIATGVDDLVRNDDEVPVLISGDGVTWRERSSLGVNPFRPTAFLDGRYFAFGKGSDSPIRGWSPVHFREDHPDGDLPEVIVSTGSSTGGTLVLGQSGAGADYGFYQVTDSPWSVAELTTGPFPTNVGAYSKLHRFGNHWFVAGGSSSWYQVDFARSEDGVNWTEVSGAKAQKLCVKDGTLYAIDMYGSLGTGLEVSSSIDGANWSALPVLLPLTLEGLSGSWYVKDAEVFGDAIFILLSNNWGTKTHLLFSGDGAGWYVARTPGMLIDIATGADQLVGLTSDGGIVQAGSQHPGTSAPDVRISYPPDRSIHLQGSTVKVSGRAVDPEGSALQVECLVDGVSIGSASEGDYLFKFPVHLSEGHVVVVRAVDEHGLWGSDEISVSATEPELPNQMTGGTPSPVVALTEFGGVAYAATENQVTRSVDGRTWTEIEIPSTGRGIHGMAANDRALVVQFEGGALAVTRDGAGWTQFQNWQFGTISTPIHDSNGWLISSNSGGDSSARAQAFASSDGSVWQVGVANGKSSLSSMVVTAEGHWVGLRNGRTVEYSVDGGNNWFPGDGIETGVAHEIAIEASPERCLAALKDGRVFSSLDGGLTWSEAGSIPPIPDEWVNAYTPLALRHESGRFYLGARGEWLYTSEDGVSWTPLAGEPVLVGRIIQFAGQFLAAGYAEPLWSRDGIRWWKSIGASYVMPETLTSIGSIVLAADPQGGIWRSSRGIVWTTAIEAAPLVVDPVQRTLGAPVIEFRNLLLAGAEGNVPTFSRDGGVTWHAANLSGRAFDARKNHTISQGNGFVIMLSRSSAYGAPSEVSRSTDGINWQLIPELNTAGIADVACDAWEAVAVAGDGTIWSSPNRGVSWSTATVEGLSAGSKALWWEGRPVVCGQDTTGGSSHPVCSIRGVDGAWGAIEAIGSETEYYRAFDVLATDRGLLACFGNGKLFRRSEIEPTWSLAATVPIPWYLQNQPLYLDYEAGRYWIWRDGLSVDWRLFTSLDSDSWEEISGNAPAANVARAGDGYVAHGNSSVGLVYSLDGVVWQPAVIGGEGGPLRYISPTTAEHFTSTDGVLWRPAPSDPPEVDVVMAMIEHDGNFFAAGRGGILIGEAEGLPDWTQVDFGIAGLDADDWVHRLESDGTSLFAAVNYVQSGYLNTYAVFRSADGRSWEEVAALADEAIVDLATDGTTWLAVGETGLLHQSIDGGVEWALVPGSPLVAGRGITRFADRWIVFGQAADPTLGTVFSSADVENWLSAGVGGELNPIPGSSLPRDPYYRVAHGRLIIGTDSWEAPLYSSDGLQWQSLGEGWIGSTSSDRYNDVVGVAGGYMAFASSPSFNQNDGTWFLPHDGLEWYRIEPLQPDFINAERVGGRLFLIGRNWIREWPEVDLALEVDPLGGIPAIVGTVVPVVLHVSNRGDVTQSAVETEVAGWLSTDRFFGDGNDRAVGRSRVVLPELPPGGSATITTAFRLPRRIPVGESRLVVQLDPDRALRETTRSNNIWVGEVPDVSVAGFELRLEVFGEGSVDRDFAERVYPAGATVSLAANSGKGATFAGWGGDALGQESQITVLMDSNKSVEAHFEARAGLQVLVRGAGSVSGVPDSGSYPLGETASLSATAVPGWTFAGWSGASTETTPATTILMDGPKVVTATFMLPLEAWRAEHFPGEPLSVSGDNEDPDRDGVRNWEEYLRGSDPHDPDSTGVLGSGMGGGYFFFRYTRLSQPESGMDLVCRASEDLSDWDHPGLEQRVLSSEEGIDTMEARIPVLGRPRGFIRLEPQRAGESVGLEVETVGSPGSQDQGAIRSAQSPP
ncbi:S8 family serine peptidase [Haloferula sp. A504]|uniref:S8 family serine peptidase n=1 Tax=Haloferula sp. A504 TaxID=3373601 RepID=UPI0031BF1CB2|nr:S8 family serine peptidase [Verrucomicrobiaceae bacterium E54]